MEKTLQQKVSQMRGYGYTCKQLAEKCGLGTSTVQQLSTGFRGANVRNSTVMAIDKLYAKLVKKHGSKEDWGVTEENQDELEAKKAEIANFIAATHDFLDALEYAKTHVSLIVHEKPSLSNQALLKKITDAIDKARGTK